MASSYRILLSKPAAADLEGIFDYTARHSPQNAGKMVGRILDSIARLEQFPRRTVVENAVGDLRHPVRSLPVPPYIVFFRVIDEQRVVRVLRVRHGAQGRPDRYD